MNAVPFTTESVFWGLGECSGLLRDDGDDLVLEFETKDTLAGLLKSGVKTVRIPAKEIVSVVISKGWVNAQIVIQTARMDLIQTVPGQRQGRLILQIARKDRELAEQFVNSLHVNVPESP